MFSYESNDYSRSYNVPEINQHRIYRLHSNDTSVILSSAYLPFHHLLEPEFVLAFEHTHIYRLLSTLRKTKRWQNGNHWANTIGADISDGFRSLNAYWNCHRAFSSYPFCFCIAREKRSSVWKWYFPSSVAADGTKRKLSKRIFYGRKKNIIALLFLFSISFVHFVFFHSKR